MLYKMKEQIKNQRQESDCEQEQMALNRENILHEQEEPKQLKQQLQT